MCFRGHAEITPEVCTRNSFESCIASPNTCLSIFVYASFFVMLLVVIIAVMIRLCHCAQSRELRSLAFSRLGLGAWIFVGVEVGVPRFRVQCG